MKICKVDNCTIKVMAKELCQAHYDRWRRYDDFSTRPEFITCQECGKSAKNSRSGNWANYCTECRKDRHRRLNKTNKFIRRINSQYGITAIQYYMMRDNQNHVCLICGNKTAGSGALITGDPFTGILIAWSTLMLGIVGAVGYAIAVTGKVSRGDVACATNALPLFTLPCAILLLWPPPPPIPYINPGYNPAFSICSFWAP